MWNPAAAGAPPPIITNPPLQGVPATQQFWPQWQAAVQYYQAASGAATDTAPVAEASGGGGNNVLNTKIITIGHCCNRIMICNNLRMFYTRTRCGCKICKYRRQYWCMVMMINH